MCRLRSGFFFFFDFLFPTPKSEMHIQPVIMLHQYKFCVYKKKKKAEVIDYLGVGGGGGGRGGERGLGRVSRVRVNTFFLRQTTVPWLYIFAGHVSCLTRNNRILEFASKTLYPLQCHDNYPTVMILDTVMILSFRTEKPRQTV